jgi:carboxyl-terminal processing protease
MLAAVPVCLLYKGYRSPDYSKEFDEIIRVFRQRYILSEWKGIDYDELYAKYKPMFDKAQEDHDEAENYAAMLAFLSEFHDGHVSYGYRREYFLEENTILSDILGEDHGLVLMNLEDGSTVAVQVDKALDEKGIHNGTIITSWNGRPIEESAAAVPVSFSLTDGHICFTADAENRYFYRSTLLAGTGGDSVEVGFISDDGSERTTSLKSEGSYYSRLKEAMNRLDQGVEGANFSWSTAKGGIPVLLIKSMFFDQRSSDEEMTQPEKSYAEMKESIRKNINEAKDKGVNDLIIDLRNNSGGSGNLIRAIAEVIGTEGEHLYNYNGVWDRTNRRYLKDPDGKFLLGKKNTFESE